MKNSKDCKHVDIIATFKDDDGNMGVITSDRVEAVQDKLKQAVMASKIMGDIFKLIKQKQS